MDREGDEGHGPGSSLWSSPLLVGAIAIGVLHVVNAALVATSQAANPLAANGLVPLLAGLVALVLFAAALLRGGNHAAAGVVAIALCLIPAILLGAPFDPRLGGASPRIAGAVLVWSGFVMAPALLSAEGADRRAVAVQVAAVLAFLVLAAPAFDLDAPYAWRQGDEWRRLALAFTEVALAAGLFAASWSLRHAPRQSPRRAGAFQPGIAFVLAPILFFVSLGIGGEFRGFVTPVVPVLLAWGALRRWHGEPRRALAATAVLVAGSVPFVACAVRDTFSGQTAMRTVSLFATGLRGATWEEAGTVDGSSVFHCGPMAFGLGLALVVSLAVLSAWRPDSGAGIGARPRGNLPE